MIDKTQAARLEHLGLTEPCSECNGRGWFSGSRYGSGDSRPCGDCRGKGWVITATGEALIALVHSVAVDSQAPGQ